MPDTDFTCYFSTEAVAVLAKGGDTASEMTLGDRGWEGLLKKINK